jgi:hypothetical protein
MNFSFQDLLELDQIGEGTLVKRSSQRSTRKVVLEEKVPPNYQFQGQCRLIPLSGTSTESQHEGIAKIS